MYHSFVLSSILGTFIIPRSHNHPRYIHRPTRQTMSPTPPPNLAIILIDPYNEFLHPKGKLYDSVASTLKSLDTITHMKTLVAFARKHKIPIYYGLHQQFKEGRNFRGWNHMTKQHVQTEQGHVFEEGSFGVEFFDGLEPGVEGNADVSEPCLELLTELLPERISKISGFLADDPCVIGFGDNADI